jgi:hypothetical protein
MRVLSDTRLLRERGRVRPLEIGSARGRGNGTMDRPREEGGVRSMIETGNVSAREKGSETGSETGRETMLLVGVMIAMCMPARSCGSVLLGVCQAYSVGSSERCPVQLHMMVCPPLSFVDPGSL